jgi:hypothetical protein
MGKHTGQKKDKWPEAVKSAADGAPAGNYTLTTVETTRPAAKSGDAPIRDYTVTLEN